MIKSMTGFGKAEAVFRNKKITAEIRSLNSKQLDLNLRLPGVYRQAEYEIRSRVTRSLQRGKVDLFISVESQAVETSAHINKAMFGAYCRQIAEACASVPELAGIRPDTQIVHSVLRMPDVLSTEAETVGDEELATLFAVVEEAAARLDAFRRQEGAILIADLLRRVELIESYKQQVEPYEKARTENVRARLLDALSKLPVEVDRNRLEQEMIYYFERLDITEEKVRLTNHCDYFRQVAATEECAGRKLGFIAQEMGREINTLGSKSNEANMQQLVVRMKDELEKIKEQVLNIL